MIKGRNFIIIPEGINNKEKHPQKKLLPNFVYRQIIEYTSKIAQNDDAVFLAPGNYFQTEFSEQELAEKYLKLIGVNGSVIQIRSSNEKYIDTLGNAEVMQKEIDIKNLTFELICEKIHSYRAEYCFRKLGYKISYVHRVPYMIIDEAIHPRVFHQKVKIIHIVYEILAFIRDFLRIKLKLHQYT